MNQAQKFDGKYVDVSEILAAGAVWDEIGNVYMFPDHSIGGFTDIRNGGAERTVTGEKIFHLVGGDIHPDYAD